VGFLTAIGLSTGFLRSEPPAGKVRQSHIAPRRPGVTAGGFVDPRQRAGTKRIAVTIDDATFARVAAFAAAEEVSFAAAARLLIERGCAALPNAKEAPPCR